MRAQKRAVPENGKVQKDEVIVLLKLAAEGKECFLRRIKVWVEEKQETTVFVTNNLKLAASTIAAIYKEHWQIELFFKALKQSLKVKTFVGTSETNTKCNPLPSRHRFRRQENRRKRTGWHL